KSRNCRDAVRRVQDRQSRSLDDLAKREPEADPSETGRDRDTRDVRQLVSLLRGIEEDRSGGHGPARKAKADQPALQTSVRAHPRPDLLADAAALASGDRGLEPHFVGDVRLAGVDPDAGSAGLDAKDLRGLRRNRNG